MKVLLLISLIFKTERPNIELPLTALHWIGDIPVSGSAAEFGRYQFICGRPFCVWFELEPMRAEYTIYGSGMPIVWSERGSLLWKE